MAKPKFVLQEREGQRPHVYNWHPGLATKPDMRPITEEEAEKYLKEEQERKASRFAHPDPEDEIEEAEDSDSEALASLEKEKEHSPIDGEAKPLVVTQEDILESQSAKIRRLQKVHTIEEWMLKKYKIPMLPMEGVEEMRDQAIEILTTLSAKNSLYE